MPQLSRSDSGGRHGDGTYLVYLPGLALAGLVAIVCTWAAASSGHVR